MWLATRAAIHRTGTHNHNLWFVAQSHPLANSILQVPHIHGVYSHFQRMPHFGVAPRQKQKPERDGSTHPEAESRKPPPPLLQHGGDPLQVRQLQAHDPRGLATRSEGKGLLVFFSPLDGAKKKRPLSVSSFLTGPRKKDGSAVQKENPRKKTHTHVTKTEEAIETGVREK